MIVIRMITLSALYVLFARPALFPTAPIPKEVERGVRVYVQGKGVDRLYFNDRQPLGTWSDGVVKREVEEAIWISPSLASRWLGYLDAKEKWPKGERERRWADLKDRLDQRLNIAVRLSAYPKKDWVSDEVAMRADVSSLEPLRFMISIDGMDIPYRQSTEIGALIWRKKLPPNGPDWKRDELVLGVSRFAQVQGRERKAVENFPWYQRTPLAEALTPMLDDPVSHSTPIRLGAFRSDWYWLEAELPQGKVPPKQFEVRIFSKTKERIATFRLAPEDKR